jgi:rhodanese-related sulfurtransferase
MKKLFVLTLFSILVLSACSISKEPAGSAEIVGKKIDVQGGQYTDVSVAELQTMLEKKDFVFINVHIPFEGDIPDTDLSIPYDEIEQNLDQLPSDKNAKIVLYCRSDRMSGIAAEKLVGLGYTNIWNLDGGMVAWEQSGLPIIGR